MKIVKRSGKKKRRKKDEKAKEGELVKSKEKKSYTLHMTSGGQQKRR
jgi:hypothetical protein